MRQQQNTKIERVVEGVESLTNAVVAAQGAQQQSQRLSAVKTVSDARQELRDALADFLKPTLRVVEN